MAGFIEILRLNTEIPRHAKQRLTDRRTTNGRTDGIPENIMPMPRIVGGGTKNCTALR